MPNKTPSLFGGAMIIAGTVIGAGMLLYRSRQKFGAGKTYKVYGGLWLMVWVFLFGIINIAAQVLSQMELVPVFKG